MHRTSARLSDNREIIYYQRSAEPFQPPPDLRNLVAHAYASEVRYDLPTGDWVVVAGHRQSRGLLPEQEDCPLCPSRAGRMTEVPAGDYEVVVFENRFPALTVAVGAPGVGVRGLDTSEEVLRLSSSGGRCEVICFSSEHDTTLADLKPDQLRLILDTWADRTRELSALPGIAQLFCFENRGPEMGVTQAHPHGQIYAYPYVTPRTSRTLRQLRQYRDAHDRNLFDDLLEAELADRRIVVDNDEWVAFVPYAARWPYEVHLYPRRRRRRLDHLDDAQREAFGPIYIDVLQRFGRLFDSATPYVSAWHQAPTADGAEDFAVHVELFTNRRTSQRLKMLGGTEVAMDAFSNDIDPDAAARRLRQLGVS